MSITSVSWQRGESCKPPHSCLGHELTFSFTSRRGSFSRVQPRGVNPQQVGGLVNGNARFGRQLGKIESFKKLKTPTVIYQEVVDQGLKIKYLQFVNDWLDLHSPTADESSLR